MFSHNKRREKRVSFYTHLKQIKTTIPHFHHNSEMHLATEKAVWIFSCEKSFVAANPKFKTPKAQSSLLRGARTILTCEKAAAETTREATTASFMVTVSVVLQYDHGGSGAFYSSMRGAKFLLASTCVSRGFNKGVTEGRPDEQMTLQKRASARTSTPECLISREPRTHASRYTGIPKKIEMEISL